MLVWKGRILEKLKTECEHGDYICEIGCPQTGMVRIKVCGRLFVERKGDEIAVPMEFIGGDGKPYNPATGDTPLSKLLAS